MSSKDRKAWEKQQRENRIIDMAEPVFFKNGYEGTTIIEIAKASGYNKRSIYLYFKDKEEIFLAVVLRGLIHMHDMLDKVSVTSDIRDMGQAFFEFSLAHPDYLKLIMVYEANTCVYQSADVPPRSGSDARDTYKKKCQAKTDAIAAVMTQCLEQAIDKKQIKTDLSPEQLMLILWGQVFGVMQIILMRQQDFKKTYGISYKDLFNTFLDMAALSLSPES